jgi:hypothetical protein
MGLCAIASNSFPAQAGATPAAGPAHGQEWLSKPGCCRGSGQVIRCRAAPYSGSRMAVPRSHCCGVAFSSRKCHPSPPLKGHVNSGTALETTAVPCPREAVFASRASMRRDAIHGCGSTLFLTDRLPTETECRRNQEPQRGRASPSPGALLPLFLRLSIRLSNSRVITCKVQRGSNCSKNHRFTEGDEAPGA